MPLYLKHVKSAQEFEHVLPRTNVKAFARIFVLSDNWKNDHDVVRIASEIQRLDSHLCVLKLISDVAAVDPGLLLDEICLFADTINMVLVAGSNAQKLAERVLDCSDVRSSSPGMPRHFFNRQLGVSCKDLETVPVAMSSTVHSKSASEAASFIVATSQELLHPTCPRIPELSSIPDKVDVVVVGAGLAGIHAAQQFKLSGRRTITIHTSNTV